MTAEDLGPCSTAQVRRHRRDPVDLGAVICRATRNSIDGGAGKQQGDRLRRTTVILQTAGIKSGRSAVEIAGPAEGTCSVVRKIVPEGKGSSRWVTVASRGGIRQNRILHD